MIEANGFDNLDDVIQPTCDRIKEILPLLEDLIPIEKKLSELGVTIVIDCNQLLNLSLNDLTDSKL